MRRNKTSVDGMLQVALASEFVMCYPPGIPIVAPGERITEEILDYIDYSKEKGCFLTGTEDAKLIHINV